MATNAVAPCDEDVPRPTSPQPPASFQNFFGDGGEVLGQMSGLAMARVTRESEIIHVRRGRLIGLQVRVKRYRTELKAVEEERDRLRTQNNLLTDERDDVREDSIMHQDQYRDAIRDREDLEDEHDSVVTQLTETQKELTELTLGIEDVLHCTVCGTTPRDPVSIRECGHTFCYNCLMTWFSVAYAKAHRDQYGGIQPVVPPILPAQLERLGLSQDTLRRIQDGQDRLALSRPKFTCPICRTPVMYGPVTNFTVAGAVERFNESAAEEGQNMRPDAEAVMRTFFREDLTKTVRGRTSSATGALSAVSAVSALSDVSAVGESIL